MDHASSNDGGGTTCGGTGVLPPRWTAQHVELRLVEAHATLIAQRCRIGPAEYGTLWPDYHDDSAIWVAAARAFRLGLATREQVATAAAMGWDEVRRVCQDAEEDAPSRPQPTYEQLTRMDRVIAWPGRYLHGHKRMGHLLDAVQRVPWAKAIGKDAGWLARQLGGPSGDVWQGRCWAACERITWGLERDRVAVF